MGSVLLTMLGKMAIQGLHRGIISNQGIVEVRQKQKRLHSSGRCDYPQSLPGNWAKMHLTRRTNEGNQLEMPLSALH